MPSSALFTLLHLDRKTTSVEKADLNNIYLWLELSGHFRLYFKLLFVKLNWKAF